MHLQLDNMDANSTVDASKRLLGGGDEEQPPHHVQMTEDDPRFIKSLPALTVQRLGVGKHVWKRLGKLMKVSYMTPYSWVAWLSYFLVGLAVATNYTQQLFVQLPKQFQHAISDSDEPKFASALVMCCVYLTILFVGNGTFKFVASCVKAILRRNASYAIHGMYMRNNVFYRAIVLDKQVDNPDERIVRDVDNWSTNWISILDKFVNCSLSVIFMTNINFSNMGYLALIPTGILFVASFLSVLLVRRVIPRVYRQQILEGDFRFAHMRIRDLAESLAFCGAKAEDHERSFLDGSVFRTVRNKISVYLGYYPIDLINELLKYGGKMLGFLVVGIPFFYVQGYRDKASVSDLLTSVFATENLMSNLQEIVQLVEYFGDVAGYTARVGEVLELDRLDLKAEKPEGTEMKAVPEAPQVVDRYVASEVTVADPTGRTLFEKLSFDIGAESSLAIQGPNGCGKSSLLRAMAGLWTCEEGTVTCPAAATFVPQKPFLGQSVGTSLRDLVTYPRSETNVVDGRVQDALRKVGLAEMSNHRRLDDEDNWQMVLSPGEQQCIVFARMLYHRPDFVLLDEATAAMSPQNERLCYEAMQDAGIHFVSVIHGDRLTAFHKEVLSLGEGEKGVEWSMSR